MIARRIIYDVSQRFANAYGRAPDSDELILALADTVVALSQLVSPGYARWPAAHRPPKPQRPAITDDAPETPSE